MKTTENYQSGAGFGETTTEIETGEEEAASEEDFASANDVGHGAGQQK